MDFEVNPNDIGISVELKNDGIHEPKSTDYLKKILLPKYRVLEVGANIGYYAVIEAQICKKVYCFEPNKENFHYLYKNTKSLKKVELFNQGMSDWNGEEKLYLSDYKNRHTIIPNSNKTETIEVTTIDAFTKNKEIDLIRMDIEGAEHKVLQGANETLTKNPPKWLFIEFHPIELGKQGVNIKDLIKYLENKRYFVRKVFYENSFFFRKRCFLNYCFSINL